MQTAHDFLQTPASSFAASVTVFELVPYSRTFLCGRLIPWSPDVDDWLLVDRDYLRRAILRYAVNLHLDSTPRRLNLIIADAVLGADKTIVSRRLLSESDARGLRWHTNQRRSLGRVARAPARTAFVAARPPAAGWRGGRSWPRGP
jgi:hypothetical protein